MQADDDLKIMVIIPDRRPMLTDLFYGAFLLLALFINYKYIGNSIAGQIIFGAFFAFKMISFTSAHMKKMNPKQAYEWIYLKYYNQPCDYFETSPSNDNPESLSRKWVNKKNNGIA